MFRCIKCELHECEFWWEKCFIHAFFCDKKTNGYLGPYCYPERRNEQLCVGMEQSFVFKESYIGPFYMTEKKRKARKYDVQKNKKRRTMKTKAELRDEMLQKKSATNIKGSAE